MPSLLGSALSENKSMKPWWRQCSKKWQLWGLRVGVSNQLDVEIRDEKSFRIHFLHQRQSDGTLCISTKLLSDTYPLSIQKYKYTNNMLCISTKLLPLSIHKLKNTNKNTVRCISTKLLSDTIYTNTNIRIPCISTKLQLVCYLSCDVLLQLHPGGKILQKNWSHIFLLDSLPALISLFLSKQCSHFLDLLSGIMVVETWVSSWSDLNPEPILIWRNKTTVTLCSLMIYSGHLCIGLPVFFNVTFQLRTLSQI